MWDLRLALPGHILRTMGVIDVELERRINASMHDVFARLSDIEGHNEWMPKKGSILRHTQQTSPDRLPWERRSSTRRASGRHRGRSWSSTHRTG